MGLPGPSAPLPASSGAEKADRSPPISAPALVLPAAEARAHAREGAFLLDSREAYRRAVPLADAVIVPLAQLLEKPGLAPMNRTVLVLDADERLAALGARELRRSGRAAFAVAGGVDAYLAASGASGPP